MTVSGTGPREKSRPKTRTNQDVTVAPVSVPQTSAAAPARRDSPAAAAPVRFDSPAAAPGGRDSPAAAPVRRDAPTETPVRRNAPTETPVRRDTTPVADDSATGLSDAIPAPVYDTCFSLPWSFINTLEKYATSYLVFSQNVFAVILRDWNLLSFHVRMMSGKKTTGMQNDIAL